MKKSEKIELVLIVGLIVLQFFTIEKVFSPLIFLFVAICLSIYYNPIKIVLTLKEDIGKYYTIAVNILLSITIILAYVALKLKDNNSVHFILLFLSIASLILLFLWKKKRKTSDFYLLILNLFLISGVFA